MDHQTLIDFSQRVQALGEQCTDLFGGQVEALKREHGIDTPRHLADAFTSLCEENRLLNIGFVGRVKAGKSSLLNALFFDGTSVLPKAATPMTAALTTLTYGDAFTAEVEFFATEDLEQIRALARQYEQQLQEKKARHFADILKRQEAQAARTGRPVNPEEVRSMADRQALNEMKRTESLAAAHEQVQCMHASGIEPSTLELNTRLVARGPDDLVGQLQEYVGARGRFMPFTKIVHVHMPLEALRDIRVIDTPGTNDPVVSREERTIALLKTCDVVFVVSPAGQFLNEDDLTLLNRITLKEGVQELALVASQVDSQLHDSEKRARLEDALASVCSNLSKQAQRNLGELKQSNPEGAGVFGALLNSVDAGLLYSAGICLTLEKQLDSPDGWGSEERRAWDNLVESYPDYFSLGNPEFSRGSLARLGNIPVIRSKLAEVRARKDAITQEKLSNLLMRKQQGLEEFRRALSLLVRNQISLVKSADIGELQGQLRTLESRRLKLQHELDLTYQHCMHEYRTGLRDGLTREANKHLRDSAEQVSSANGTYTEQERRKKSGFFSWCAGLWGGGYETVTVTQSSVMTGQVAAALEGFLFQVEQLLSDTASSARYQLDRKLASTLTPAVRQVLEDDCNSELVLRAINGVVNSLRTEPFSLEIALPSELRSRGTLKGYQAENYAEEAQDFVAGLANTVTRKIGQFVQELERSAPRSVSDIFINALEEQIRTLEDQVHNAAQTIERLEKTQRELEGVSG